MDILIDMNFAHLTILPLLTLVLTIVLIFKAIKFKNSLLDIKNGIDGVNTKSRVYRKISKDLLKLYIIRLNLLKRSVFCNSYTKISIQELIDDAKRKLLILNMKDD